MNITLEQEEAKKRRSGMSTPKLPDEYVTKVKSARRMKEDPIKELKNLEGYQKILKGKVFEQEMRSIPEE